jgi:hypothetical protein
MMHAKLPMNKGTGLPKETHFSHMIKPPRIIVPLRFEPYLMFSRVRDNE